MDLNQALNNLLSREDDDGEDEGPGGVGLGMPSGGVCACVGGWVCVCVMVCILPAEELLSLLGSGLVGVADDELEEALGPSGGGRGHVAEEGEESGGGRESRISLYEFSNHVLQVSHTQLCDRRSEVIVHDVACANCRMRCVRWSASGMERRVGVQRPLDPPCLWTAACQGPCPLSGGVLKWERERVRREKVEVGVQPGSGYPRQPVVLGVAAARRRRDLVVR